MMFAPNGLKRKTRHGLAGQTNSAASPCSMRIGQRALPAAIQRLALACAVAASAGFSSTPTTSRKPQFGGKQDGPAFAAAEVDEGGSR